MPGAEFNQLISEKERLFADYQTLLSKSDFANAISRHSSSQKGVLDSYQGVTELIQNFLGNEKVPNQELAKQN